MSIHICYLVFYVIPQSCIVTSAVEFKYALNKKSSPLHGEPQSYIKRDYTCRQHQSFGWCLPFDYDNQDEPWKYKQITNSSLPWYYHFYFYIFEIQEVDDQKRIIALNMYFIVKWFEPRLHINVTTTDWYDAANIKRNYIPIPLEHMENFWYPDLDIPGIKMYDSKSALREMASFKVS